MYVIELLIKGKDKHNEVSFFRLRSSNGKPIMQSEKYKNVNFSIRKAKNIAMNMGAIYKQIRNGRTELKKNYDEIEII